jgi:hypothetical protein
MIRCDVQFQMKFWQHNPIVLQLHARNGAVENIGVILQNFWPDPNLASCHKHALSITLRLSKKRGNSESTRLTCGAHVKCGGLK